MSRPPTLQSLSGTGLPAPNPKVFCQPEPHAPLSFFPLFCTTSESSSLRFQSLGRSSAPLRGVRDGLVSIFLFPVSSFVFQLSATPLFATLTQTAGVCIISSQIGNGASAPAEKGSAGVLLPRPYRKRPTRIAKQPTD